MYHASELMNELQVKMFITCGSHRRGVLIGTGIAGGSPFRHSSSNRFWRGNLCPFHGKVSDVYLKCYATKRTRSLCSSYLRYLR